MQATDEHKLAELGYRQDLKRDWSMLHNFGVSFSIIVRLGRFCEGADADRARRVLLLVSQRTMPYSYFPGLTSTDLLPAFFSMVSIPEDQV